MATNTQASVQFALLAGDEVLEGHGAHLALVVGEVFADRRIPDRLDFRVGQHALRHDLGGPEFVAAVDQIDLAGKAGEEIRLLAGAVAAADHATGTSR